MGGERTARRHVRGQPSPQGAADAADAAAATTASPPVAAHRMARNCAGATRGEELASLSDDEVHARSKVAARAEPAAPRAKRREKPAAVPKSGAMPLSVLHKRRASGSDADREPGGAAARRRGAVRPAQEPSAP